MFLHFFLQLFATTFDIIIIVTMTCFLVNFTLDIVVKLDFHCSTVYSTYSSCNEAYPVFVILFNKLNKIATKLT